MTTLDSRRYFADLRVAAMVDAVQQGDVPGVTHALASGISANAPGSQGFRPIHFVFVAKDPSVLQLLLSAGADPNARLANGNPPLYFAVRLPNSDFTRVLLAAGADPNAQGEHRQPVIHEAIYARMAANVVLLAQAGADVNAVWGGSTPLLAAITTFAWPLATTLLDLNADTVFRDHAGVSAVDQFCAHIARVPPSAANRQGIPPLYAALQRRGVAIPCEETVRRFL